MTDEVQTPEVVEELTQEQEDAAFTAGFADARGEQPPAEAEPEVTPDAQEEPAPEVQEEEPKPQEQEETPPELFAGLTREQLMESLAKAAKAEEETRKAFGKIGELQRTIQGLQQSGNGQAVEITKEDFEDLAEDYPDLAEKIARGLNGKLKVGAAAQAPAFDPSEFDSRIEAAKQELEQKYEMKLLGLQHPDWKDVASSNDFQVWKGTQPQEVQLELDNSWDAAFLSNALTQFKGWRDQSKQIKQERSSRLEAAVTPQGAPAKAGLNEDDAFQAGWKAVRGR